MTKISKIEKNNLVGGIGKYPWNNAIYAGLVGQSLNSVLSLVNQIVYYNNPNPYYSNPSLYNDSSSRLYIRAQSTPLKSNVSIGNPFL